MLTNTQGHAEGLNEAGTGIQSALGSAAGASGSNTVSEALLGFWNSGATPGLTACVTRVNACLQGATAATRAYIDGDLEMAANAQSSASAVSGPSFEQNGGERNIPR